MDVSGIRGIIQISNSTTRRARELFGGSKDTSIAHTELPEHPSFHVVALSLPGYGFSEAPKKRGFAGVTVCRGEHRRRPIPRVLYSQTTFMFSRLVIN